MKLNGKVAIVTGASSGIGRAGALALAEAGADVVVNGRSQMQKAEESAKNKSFLGLSRRLESQSRDIEARLKEKRGEGLLPALLRLRATCFECHKKHRS